MQNSIIRFESVSLQYGNGPEILKNVSFSLYPGSFHYLTGASGAGKSSLIKLMYYGFKDYQGSIHAFGRELRYMKNQEIALYRQQIGVVFQNFYLLDHLTTLDNIALPLRLKGEGWTECRRKAQQMMKWIGLGGFEDAMPATLSGGQKQRSVIARSVMNKPRLLLADEPTGNLDDENAAKLLYLFEELNRSGITIVMATHNKDLATEFPHPIIHLEEGHISIYPLFGRERVASNG